MNMQNETAVTGQNELTKTILPSLDQVTDLVRQSLIQDLQQWIDMKPMISLSASLSAARTTSSGLGPPGREKFISVALSRSWPITVAKDATRKRCAISKILHRQRNALASQKVI
jgi:hypothetical protein